MIAYHDFCVTSETVISLRAGRRNTVDAVNEATIGLTHGSQGQPILGEHVNFRFETMQDRQRFCHALRSLADLMDNVRSPATETALDELQVFVSMSELKCHWWDPEVRRWRTEYDYGHFVGIESGFCVSCGTRLNRDGTEEPRGKLVLTTYEIHNECGCLVAELEEGNKGTDEILAPGWTLVRRETWTVVVLEGEAECP